MDVGFCGIGNMGAAMVSRLLDRGHRLSVWNRTADRAEQFFNRGAVQAKDPADVTRHHSVILTSLRDDQAIREVYEGPDGLLGPDCQGRLFIDTSTIHAETLGTIADQARAKGAAILECPVAGTPARARDGELMGFAGGDAKDFERAQPILNDLCRRLDHFGPLGAGNAVKLAVNLPLLVYFAALGEALALVRDVPADPQKIVSVLAESPGAAGAMAYSAPWITESLRRSGRETGDRIIDLGVVRKDLQLMLDAGGRDGVALPVTMAARDSYDEAIAGGWADRPFWMLSLYRRSNG